MWSRYQVVFLSLVAFLLGGCADDSEPPTSSDGPVTMYTWTKRSLTDGEQFQAIEIAGAGNLLGGIANTISGNNVLVSFNGGSSWSERAQLGLTDYRGISHVGGKYFVLGGMLLVSSNDMIHWDTASWLTGDSCFCTLQTMAYSGTYYVAIGPNAVAVSTNGTMWLLYDRSLITSETATLRKIGWANNKFVMMVTNRDSVRTDFYISTNAANWSRLSSVPGTTINDFCPNGAGGAVVGEQGEVWYSSDLITWKQGDAGTQQDLIGICRANNQYMAVGTGGTIIGSRLGDVWSGMSSGTPATILDIIWTGSRYVAVGENILLTSD